MSFGLLHKLRVQQLCLLLLGTRGRVGEQQRVGEEKWLNPAASPRELRAAPETLPKAPFCHHHPDGQRGWSCLCTPTADSLPAARSSNSRDWGKGEEGAPSRTHRGRDGIWILLHKLKQ